MANDTRTRTPVTSPCHTGQFNIAELHDAGQYWLAVFLFVAYTLFLTVIMLNLLIAILSHICESFPSSDCAAHHIRLTAALQTRRSKTMWTRSLRANAPRSYWSWNPG